MSAAEKWRILETMVEYGRLVSSRRYEEWAELFVEDGRFITPAGVRSTGRAELADNVRESQRDWGPFRQFTANPVVDVTGDSATATADWLVIRVAAGKSEIHRMGRYHDVLRRDADRWRFVSRFVESFEGNWPEILESP